MSATLNKEHLMELIKDTVRSGKRSDWHKIELFDTSKIEDLSYAFYYTDNIPEDMDLSGWDVSNVSSMYRMFDGSDFNGDLSSWDASNIEDMNGIFAHSNFNGDLSNWNIDKVTKGRDDIVLRILECKESNIIQSKSSMKNINFKI